MSERLADGGRDQLSLGDCNLVYRFAQGPLGRISHRLRPELDGGQRPAPTWLQFHLRRRLLSRLSRGSLSTELDCGTLGLAGSFRFRTTAGVVLHGVVTYVGYEYTDIGRGHWNGLIGGLRLWF